PTIPTFIGGSADLNPSTNTGMKGGGDFQAPVAPGSEEIQGELGGDWGYDGRNIHWGIREHAMGSAVNGMAAHGGVFPFSATFLVFSDYMRAPIRLAALSGYKSIFVFTHDSIAVGEDGPTHEPVEQVMSLRLIPGLNVIRPADANETAQAWVLAVQGPGPTALILSRQNLPVLEGTAGNAGVSRGAYVLDEVGPAGDDDLPDLTLVGTGSEVWVCLDAARTLADDGLRVRVVSMPCWEDFDEQDEAYQAEVLPGAVPTLAVEAGVSFGWDRWADETVAIDRFGASAPGDVALRELGISPSHVAERAHALLAEIDR
ncbi:MAG: transketolase, partial [Actinobacteria bacterium]|nr:transketolase [Actinomycetota bacterium]